MNLFRKKQKNTLSKAEASKVSGGSSHISTHPENDARRDFVKRRVKVPLLILERPLMSDTEFVVDIRYKHVKLIGSGSYGIVCSAIDSVSGSRVAIKKIMNAFGSSRMARNVLREIRLLRHLRHSHIVQLLDVDVPRLYQSWNEVYLVTPLLKTDLRDLLKKKGLQDPKVKKKIAYQLLCALRDLHKVGIMHRDVKSRNLLLDEDLNVQLCDLGQSRFYSKTNGSDDELHVPVKEPELTGGVSTMIQSAPELSLGAPYDAEVDIWAAACVIAEMLHPEHRFLFDNASKQSHVQEIINIVGFPSDDLVSILPDYGAWYLRRMRKGNGVGSGIRGILGSGVDEIGVNLLEQMLKFSPKDRVSAKIALRHEWFDEVRDELEGKRKQKGGNADGEGNVSESVYDFALSEPPRKTAKSVLKELVWEEVVAFHPEATELGVR